jgi:hypothetical protein
MTKTSCTFRKSYLDFAGCRRVGLSASAPRNKGFGYRRRRPGRTVPSVAGRRSDHPSPTDHPSPAVDLLAGDRPTHRPGPEQCCRTRGPPRVPRQSISCGFPSAVMMENRLAETPFPGPSNSAGRIWPASLRRDDSREPRWNTGARDASTRARPLFFPRADARFKKLRGY